MKEIELLGGNPTIIAVGGRSYNVFCQIIAYNILEAEYLIGYEQFLIR